MFKVRKRMEVAGSHLLELPYNSKCTNLHGHNWIITVTVSGEYLNRSGMLIDFTHIKNVVDQLDHTCINEVFSQNPTAENIAKYIADQINEYIEHLFIEKDFLFKEEKVPHPKVESVEVQESEGNTAIYIP